MHVLFLMTMNSILLSILSEGFEARPQALNGNVLYFVF